MENRDANNSDRRNEPDSRSASRATVAKPGWDVS